MKILKLNLKNINSLKGENFIDFQKYFDNSLFLITGDTGAGKTTILDAICCALYNQTPRLKDTRQLLSKHTAEANITLEYEVKNIRYRNSWSIQRAYKKVDGALANAPKMEIAKLDEDSDEYLILETKISLIPKMVQDITGLDFSQFQKSMLLSQGNFDAFLKAKVNERADLLEKMTGTGIYAEIGKKSYEVYKEKTIAIQEMRFKLGEIIVFDDENLTEHKNQLSKFKKEILKLSKEQDKNSKTLELLSKKETLNIDIDNFTKTINKSKESLKNLQRDKKTLAKDLENQEQLESDFSFKYKKEIKVIDKVVELDIKLQTVQKKEQEILTDIENLSKKEKELEKSHLAKKDEITQLKNQNKTAIKYLVSNYKDEKLLVDFAFIDSKIDVYLKLQASIEKDSKSLQKIIKENNKLTQNLLNDTKNLKESKIKVHYIESKTIVLKYEDERDVLQTDEACPLCGSLEHPYKSKNYIFDSKIDELLKEKTEILKDIKIYEKTIQELQNKEIQNKTKIQSLNEVLVSLNSEFKDLDNGLNSFADRYNFTLKDDLKLVQIQLKNRYDTFLSNKTKVDNYNQELVKKETDIKILDTQKIANSEQTKKELSELESTKDESIRLLESRTTLFAKKETKKEKKELENQKDSLLKILNTLKDKVQKNSAIIDSTQKKTEEYQELVDSKTKELKCFNSELQDVDKEQLIEESKSIKEGLESSNREFGELSQKLKENETKLKSSKSLLDTIAIEEKKIKPYEILKELIGDSEGKKFKKFAQNLTLGHLLLLANKHLKTLNERYVLLKDKTKDLEILVVDTYQANISRSVNSLSGGESFLVSLALALGLSDMVSSKVSIDSLFLDEGFGTLDAQTLSDALTTLSRLQNSGKMIGIISHVEALKSEIGSQIKVKKSSGGVGRILIST